MDLMKIIDFMANLNCFFIENKNGKLMDLMEKMLIGKVFKM